MAKTATATPDLPTTASQKILPLSAADRSGTPLKNVTEANAAILTDANTAGAAPLADVKIDPTERSVTAPLLPLVVRGFVRRRHDVRLNHLQAATLSQLSLGLSNQGAQTADGKFVSNGADAVRWLLEQLAETAG